MPERLVWLTAMHAVLSHIRRDDRTEFTAKAVREWLKRVAVNALFIELGLPWENAYVENSNGKLVDELLER